MTPLHQAARQGHANTCRLLLDAGAAVDVADEEGDTALHNVFHEPCPDEGDTLLHLICRDRCATADEIRLLLTQGADANDRRSEFSGKTDQAITHREKQASNRCAGRLFYTSVQIWLNACEH